MLSATKLLCRLARQNTEPVTQYVYSSGFISFAAAEPNTQVTQAYAAPVLPHIPHSAALPVANTHNHHQAFVCSTVRNFCSSGSNEPAGKQAAPQGTHARRQAPGSQTDENKHPHFSMQDMVKAQPLLEEIEVGQAVIGVTKGAWVDLYETPLQSQLQQLVWTPLASLRKALLASFYTRLSSISESLVTQVVEGSFSSEEFVDGSKTAISAVMELIGSQDYDKLKALASERLVQRVQGSIEALADTTKLKLTGIKTTIHKAQLASSNLWTGDHMAMFDENWASEATDNTSDSWLVVALKVDASLEVSAMTEGGEPKQWTVSRQGTWLFTRGPLPKGFSTSLYLPWRVLAFF